MHRRSLSVLLFPILILLIGHSPTLIFQSPGRAPVAVAATSGFQSCSATTPASVNSGDNDGFQVNPIDACTDGGGYAQDIDSGTSTKMACGDLGKDRQLFYDYGLAIPSGSVVEGIEVRVDAWFDGSLGAVALMCIELSWDSGTTWTVAKMTPPLTTAETTHVLGSPHDSWGRAWADADLLDVNFRVRVTNLATNIDHDFSLDWVAVQVTHTGAAPTPTATPAPTSTPIATPTQGGLQTPSLGATPTALTPSLGAIPIATVISSSTGALTTTAASTPTPTPVSNFAQIASSSPKPTRTPAVKGVVAPPANGIDPSFGTALMVLLLCAAAVVAVFQRPGAPKAN